MRAFSRILAAVALVTAAPLAVAQQTIVLEDLKPISRTIGPNQFSNAFVIDVGSETELTLALLADNTANDVDLLLRYGSPFPDRTFSGLALDEALARRDVEPRCGLAVVDLKSGDMTGWVRIEGVVRELYDVAFIPGVRRPSVIGFKTDEVKRVISIDD